MLLSRTDLQLIYLYLPSFLFPSSSLLSLQAPALLRNLRFCGIALFIRVLVHMFRNVTSRAELYVFEQKFMQSSGMLQVAHREPQWVKRTSQDLLRRKILLADQLQSGCYSHVRILTSG